MQQDEKRIAGLVPTRLTLSDDKGLCTMYFTCEDDAFLKKLETLKLYKPSIRKQLSSNIKGRYTPDILFKFDDISFIGQQISGFKFLLMSVVVIS